MELCADCLNEILPKEISQCFGVGAINLDTKEIRLFEKSLGGFGLGDFHIYCNLKEQKHGDSSRMNLLIFYCPLQYETEPRQGVYLPAQRCRKERPTGATKATPSGVFDWPQSGQSGAWGDPNQRFMDIQKNIHETLLAYAYAVLRRL